VSLSKAARKKHKTLSGKQTKAKNMLGNGSSGGEFISVSQEEEEGVQENTYMLCN
jgi:hypothetical protein